MLSGWNDKLNAAQQESAPEPAPVLLIPDGAILVDANGAPKGTLVAMQTIISYWSGNITGVAHAPDGGFTRLFVKRIVEAQRLMQPHTDVELCFKTKPGLKVIDTAYRPARRLDVVVKRIPPVAFPDTLPWRQSVAAIKTAIKWATVQAHANKDRHYGLVIIGTIDDEGIEREFRGEEYDEHKLLGILAIEVCELKSRDAVLADWALEGVEAPEETTDGTSGVDSDADGDMDAYFTKKGQ